MSNARLIAALEEAARHQPIRLPIERYFPTSLRAAPPARAGKPSEPPEPPSTGIVPAELYEAPVQRLPEAPGEVRPVWQALLDVSVWRTRRWWRLAAAMVVQRHKNP